MSAGSARIRILTVDDHPLLRAGIEAGNPLGLSSTQKDSMYGCSSARGVTNEIFIAVPAVTLP